MWLQNSERLPCCSDRKLDSVLVGVVNVLDHAIAMDDAQALMVVVSNFQGGFDKILQKKFVDMLPQIAEIFLVLSRYAAAARVSRFEYFR